jgi:hypothetical protein
MLRFVSGCALGFLTGLAVENRSHARRFTEVGVSVAIALLDVGRRLVEDERKQLKEILDAVDGAALRIHAVHRQRAAT